MLFNDRRKGLSLANQANDSMIKRNQDKESINPLDLRNSPRKLRKNISKVDMEGAYGTPTTSNKKEMW
jgi:hypothetical protein